MLLENVVTSEEFPLSKAQQVLKKETIAVIGYGVQGPGQALNQRDNGIQCDCWSEKKFQDIGIKQLKTGLYPVKLCLKLKKHCREEPSFAIS